jgi:two-component system nitrate/nitrite response regulator NarL
MPHPTIQVAILDDHQSIIDGYLYRLQKVPSIEVVLTCNYGCILEDEIKNHQIDVLLLDVGVPISEDKLCTPTPTLSLISSLLRKYPKLAVLPISMHTERSIIKATVEYGASGYVFKDDRASIFELGQIIMSIANGGMYFSKEAHNILMKGNSSQAPLLTSRQVEVLGLIVAYPELTSAEAARKLNIANSTLRNLLSNAFQRLEVPNRNAAIIKAQQLNLVPTASQKAPNLEKLQDESRLGLETE